MTPEATMGMPSETVPYSIALADGSRLAISLPRAWVRGDRDGEPLLLPPAVRQIDRLRALFTASDAPISPGFLISLREAMALTRDDFARIAGVGREELDDWEHGRSRPADSAIAFLRTFAANAARIGVRIDADRRSA